MTRHQSRKQYKKFDYSSCVCPKCGGTWRGCWEKSNHYRRCIHCGHEWTTGGQDDELDSTDDEDILVSEL